MKPKVKRKEKETTRCTGSSLVAACFSSLWLSDPKRSNAKHLVSADLTANPPQPSQAAAVGMAARRATKAGGQLFVHGLTGGIASTSVIMFTCLSRPSLLHKPHGPTPTPRPTAGKTHACKVLQGLGAQVLNADHLAHQCYLPGQPAHAAIKRAFGSGVLAPDGTVDRRRLGEIVFAAPEQVCGGFVCIPIFALCNLTPSTLYFKFQLQVLNGIMFSATQARVRAEVGRLGGQGHRWVVVEAALLLEAEWDAWMDEVWCMAVPPSTAVARIVQRNGLPAEAAEQRVRSQMPNEARAARAAVVIDSSGPKRETAAKLTEAAAALRRRVLKEYGFDLVVGEGGRPGQEP